MRRKSAFSPRSAALLLAWGEALAGQGAYERAIAVTERLLRFAPTLEAAHRALMGVTARP